MGKSSRISRAKEQSSERTKFLDRKHAMGLDPFGYPSTAIANNLLLQQASYGDNTRGLEKTWTEWIDYNPFDSRVAVRLAKLTAERLAQSNDADNTAHQLQRRSKLLENRINRYQVEKGGYSKSSK